MSGDSGRVFYQFTCIPSCIKYSDAFLDVHVHECLRWLSYINLTPYGWMVAGLLWSQRTEDVNDGFPITWKTRQSMWRRWNFWWLEGFGYIRPYPCTRSASICGLADGTYCLKKSTLAMSNSKELHAGKCYNHVLSAWHAHVYVVEWQPFHRPNSAIILEGRPEPGLLAMLPVSWYFSICKPFFVARITLTLVKGTVTNRTNT